MDITISNTETNLDAILPLAVNNLKSAGGGTLTIAPGIYTYNASSLLIDFSNITIKGYNAIILIDVQGNGTFIKLGHSITRPQNILIEGLTIIGDTSSYTAGKGYNGIHIQGGENIILRNLIIRRMTQYGILLRDLSTNANTKITNITLDNVKVLENTGNPSGTSTIALETSSDSTDRSNIHKLYILNCHFQVKDVNGILGDNFACCKLQACQSVWIDNTTFEGGNSTEGLLTFAPTLPLNDPNLSATDYAKTISKDAYVSNCHFKDGGIGIRIISPPFIKENEANELVTTTFPLNINIRDCNLKYTSLGVAMYEGTKGVKIRNCQVPRLFFREQEDIGSLTYTPSNLIFDNIEILDETLYHHANCINSLFRNCTFRGLELIFSHPNTYLNCNFLSVVTDEEDIEPGNRFERCTFKKTKDIHSDNAFYKQCLFASTFERRLNYEIYSNLSIFTDNVFWIPDITDPEPTNTYILRFQGNLNQVAYNRFIQSLPKSHNMAIGVWDQGTLTNFIGNVIDIKSTNQTFPPQT